MTNRKLKAELLRKLGGITPQALSKRVKRTMRQIPMSTEDAIYCIAHREGIRLDKYLVPEEVDRVRTLLTQFPDSRTPTVSGRHHNGRRVVVTREVHIGAGFSLSDPLLPESVINESKEMASRVYPMLYIFENSVRELVQRLLKRKFGDDWWDKANIPPDIRREVRGRQERENKEAWHGKRGAHAIFYTNIADLVSIVKNNWEAFDKVFGRQDWFTNLVQCMELSRNTVAHMNPLHKHDADRVRVNLRDWQQMIGAKKALIDECDLPPEN